MGVLDNLTELLNKKEDVTNEDNDVNENLLVEKQAKTDALDYAADAGLNNPKLKKALKKFKVKMKIVADPGVNGWPEVVFSGEEKNLIAFLKHEDGYGLDYISYPQKPMPPAEVKSDYMV